ncbi:MAG: AMIN domain-containing protein, partial [Burkholderiaceae bacterium]
MVGALLISLSAYAQNTIEAVTGSIQGGSEVIRVDLAQPLPAVPGGFSIQVPARIALDLPGVTNGLGRPTVEINQGNLRSVNVVQAGDRTRMVLNLKQATGYKTEIRGKSLFITLEPVQAAAPVTAQAPVFAENRNRDVLPIKDLDFRRGGEGAGRVIVDLANNQVGVDIKQQGQTLVVEFLKSSLPEGMRRRLDVADFGTPIQTVTTFQNGDRVRMVIEPRGAWEHSAYQSDNQFVVEVRQLKVDATKLVQGTGFTGEKLSLNFQNIEVRSLLQVIADFTNFNIVTSDTVTGSVTLRLKDVPWDQALDIILRAKGLAMRKVGTVLWIAPRDELAAKEKQELEANQAIQNLEPLKSISIQLNYTKVNDILGQISGTGGLNQSVQAGAKLLSPRGTVFGEPRTNQLFVTDIPSRLVLIQEMVTKLDVAVRQVLIEARIVEAQDTFGKSLGIRLGGVDLRGVRGGEAGYGLNNTNRVAGAGTYEAIGGTTGQTNTALDALNTTLVNLPAIG